MPPRDWKSIRFLWMQTRHYWKTTADNLPWICVRDGNGIYSSIAASYNVKNVPSVFLVNKNNELSARGESIKDLEAAVKALL